MYCLFTGREVEVETEERVMTMMIGEDIMTEEVMKIEEDMMTREDMKTE